jgi:EAL domain-containing protein (putative c-di-GMP-specific phosphodiesterase class I)
MKTILESIDSRIENCNQMLLNLPEHTENYDKIADALENSIQYLERYYDIIKDKPIIMEALNKAQFLYAKDGLDIMKSLEHFMLAKQEGLIKLNLWEAIKADIPNPPIEEIQKISGERFCVMLSLQNKFDLYYLYVFINLSYLVSISDTVLENSLDNIGIFYINILSRLSQGLYQKIKFYINIELDDLYDNTENEPHLFNRDYVATTIMNNIVIDMLQLKDFGASTYNLSKIKESVVDLFKLEKETMDKIIVNETKIEVGMRGTIPESKKGSVNGKVINVDFANRKKK